MKVRLFAAARLELDDAVARDDEQAPGLGRDFLDETDRAVRRAVAFTMSCSKIEPDMRRCLLARFPYGSIFGVDGQTLIVPPWRTRIANRATGSIVFDIRASPLRSIGGTNLRAIKGRRLERRRAASQARC